MLRVLVRGLSWAAILLGFLAGAGQAFAQYRIEAYSGRPFGVGRIEVRLPPQWWPEGMGLEGLGVSEKSGRVLYPVVNTKGTIPTVVKDILNQTRRPWGPLVGGILRDIEAPAADIYFLFQGDAPLELAIESRRVDRMVVPPSPDSRRFDRLFRVWWHQYTREPGLLEVKADCPPIVENYLCAMLSRRLGLPLAEPGPVIGLGKAIFRSEVGLALNTEFALIDIERERMLGRIPLNETADQPLPEPLVTEAPAYPQIDKKIDIEPIAMRVPADSFYIRYGSFSNFLWFQDTLARWGGDLQNLVSLRGVNYGVSQRIEEQLVLKSSALARLFGDAIIADVALVGYDLYLPDGASFGLLFYARNSLLLANDIRQQRAERIKKGGVTEQKIEIAGHEVSVLTAPDGSVRSYYASDGPYHLVSRSETLVRRFLETAGGQSLGSSAGLRHARSLMPLDRQDTVFLYFSDGFFRQMVSPAFRIELSRRLHALADVELLKMATLAAAAEGTQGGSIQTLMDGGFLPAEFGRRPDGSQAVLTDEGVYDSARGWRGALVPLADMSITTASPREIEDYRRFVDYFRSNWGRLDPVQIALKRQPPKGGVEHVAIDVNMSPLSAENFRIVRKSVGAPDQQRLAPVPGDIAHAEAILPQQRLFGGLKDVGFAPRPVEGPIPLPGILRGFLVGYAGADGPLGPLGFLNLGIPAETDSSGMAVGLLGGWRLSRGPFTVFSFQPEILSAVGPQLRYEGGQPSAQARINIGDVSQARITPTLNNVGYARTRETSRGNLRLLAQMEQQLHVPTRSAREAAELLLDAKLTCPLGGQYEVRESADGAAWWMSTALDHAAEGGLFSTVAPEGFLAPPLNWFRGLAAYGIASEKELSLHAEIDMKMPEEK